MADTTTPLEFPFPEGPDSTDVPGDIQGLAEAVNDWLNVNVYFRLEGLAADRPAASSTFARTMYWATDTHVLSFCDGASWFPLSDLSGVLALAGGSMSGTVNFQDHVLQRPELKDAAETARIVATSGAAQTIDFAVAAVQDITLDQTCVLSLTNPPAPGKSGSLLVIIRQPGVLRAVTWPASVKWPGGNAPAMAISTVNTFALTTVDGGTTWLAVTCGLDHR